MHGFFFFFFFFWFEVDFILIRCFTLISLSDIMLSGEQSDHALTNVWGHVDARHQFETLDKLRAKYPQSETFNVNGVHAPLAATPISAALEVCFSLCQFFLLRSFTDERVNSDAS